MNVSKVSQKVRSLVLNFPMQCVLTLGGSIVLAINVIRMVKLFGWETQLSNQLAEKREVELRYVWKIKLLELLITCIK